MQSSASTESLPSPEFNAEKVSRDLLEYIIDGDRDSLSALLSNYPTRVLQLLLTFTLDNLDKQVYYDEQVLNDACELLGVA